MAFPISTLDKSILADILRGAADKVSEAGATLVGGHSIDDKEPKFGLAVTGLVHPDKVRTNASARPGDKLILTKPIGVGILTTSIKKDQLSPEETARLTAVMSTLNKTAAEVMDSYDVHACTDVTGFGLLGHASEMAKGSGFGLIIRKDDVPVLPRVRELAESGFVPGGTRNNFAHLEGSVVFPESLDQIGRYILCDAVTSGGLLISIGADESGQLLADLLAAGVEAAEIGEVTDEHPGIITVI
ncbi:Selenide, water dikinase [compost metagenome]